ncbi:MAG: POTRA domain-containing protein [Minicystis sp.]
MFLRERGLPVLGIIQARGSALALTLALAVISGCASIPRGTAAVDSVDVQGNKAIPDEDIEGKVATTPSPKFLGLFRGVVYDYELFDRSVLQRDLERVERYYRARGYYEARARAGRIRYRNDNHVQVTIEVEEGRPVLVRERRIEGIDALAPRDARAVRGAMTDLVKENRPFEEEPFSKAEAAMRQALTDRGYAWAKVERRADVDLPNHFADLLFTVRLGPRARFGPIRFQGLRELPEGPVRRALDITEGEPYSTEALRAAERAVLDLGTFSSVAVLPSLREPPPPDGVVPLTVRLVPQKLRSVTLGGGLELDSTRTEVHARVGWEHKNLFGGFRHFTIDFRPGFNLYPTRLPSLDAPEKVLPEERLRAELEAPGLPRGADEPGAAPGGQHVCGAVDAAGRARHGGDRVFRIPGSRRARSHVRAALPGPELQLPAQLPLCLRGGARSGSRGDHALVRGPARAARFPGRSAAPAQGPLSPE